MGVDICLVWGESKFLDVRSWRKKKVPLAKALPMKFSIPSLLLSSLEGLGHLFTCLDTLPSRCGQANFEKGLGRNCWSLVEIL